MLKIDTIDKAIKYLKIFNQNVDEIWNSRLMKWFDKNKLKVILFSETGKESTFPEKEDIKSFILTFRKFSQDNDVSIRNISQIYSNFNLEENTTLIFNQQRTKLNNFLNSSCRAQLKGFNALDDLTNRKLLHTFIYGGLAHDSEAHYDNYQMIKENPYIRDLLWMEFHLALHTMFLYVKNIALINERALVELESRKE